MSSDSFNVIETFSGIGAQAKALNNLSTRFNDFNYEIKATVEWEIGAIIAYDIIHNGKQDLSEYSSFTKQELINKIQEYNISNDGKEPMSNESIKRMNPEYIKAILYSIENNKNLIDISSVHANNLPDAELLTYSFPCQDLSISSYWHNNFTGIDKGANNRSSLLWEIERILFEYDEQNKILPRFLLMENVTAIENSRHKKNFLIWQNRLEELGYKNVCLKLNAINFGIPQNRRRTFMVSFYKNDLSKENTEEIYNLFKEIESIENPPPNIGGFLRLNYNNKTYYQEALLSTPNDTASRRKISDASIPLAYGKKPTDHIAKTITTKQDRLPNAGVIKHQGELGEGKADYRNLTPRETFLLMGFEEKDYQLLMDNNSLINKSRRMLSNAKLYKLAGNSIAVNILESIFEKMHYVNINMINKKEGMTAQ